MNLPNKLTILRIIMIPIFVALFFLSVIPYNFLIACAVFCIAAFTDFLDGYIARKQNLVTNLGKFLDPIADKILVSTALIIMLVPVGTFAILPWYASIAVAIILARELMVSGFRIIAASKGKVLAADKSGKIKTFLQDIAIIVLLAGASLNPGLYSVTNIIGLVVLGVATILTIVSGIEYLVKNRQVLQDEDTPTVNNEEEQDKGDDGYVEIDGEELFVMALEEAITQGQISISHLKRRFPISYSMAGKLVDKMEKLGYVSGFDGVKPRKVLITREEFEEKYGEGL